MDDQRSLGWLLIICRKPIFSAETELSAVSVEEWKWFSARLLYFWVCPSHWTAPRSLALKLIAC